MVKFSGKIDEKVFYDHLELTNVSRISRTFKYSSIVMLVMTVWVLATRARLLTVLCNLGVSILHAGCSWRCRGNRGSSKYFSIRGVAGCVISGTHLLLALGQVPSAYDGLVCRGLDDTEQDYSSPLLFGLIFGAYPVITTLYSIIVEIFMLRDVLAMMIFGICCSAVRSLMITPIPSLSISPWIIVNYIGFPMLLWAVAQHSETRKRETYLYKTRLEAELQETLQALAFEKPTELEQKEVYDIFGPGGSNSSFSLNSSV